MAVLQVGKDGKAPAGAKVGDTIKTAGGDYKITGGTSGNWKSEKVTTPKPPSGGGGSGSKSGSSSGSGNTVKVNPNGKAPGGLSVGTVVSTAGGDYKIVGVNPDGSYKSQKVTSGNVVANSNQPEKPQASSVAGGKTPTTFLRNGQEVKGYIEDGKTYDEQGNRAIAGDIVSAAGKKYLMSKLGGLDITNAFETDLHREEEDEYGNKVLAPQNRKAYIVDGKTYDAMGNELGIGDIVKAAGDKYYQMTANGGVAYTPPMIPDEAPVALEDPNLQRLLDMINEIGLVDSPTLGNTLTWEEAMARAGGNLNPQFNQAMDSTMSALDEKALRSGFYGQLPTEALKRQAAGSLEVEKLNAIYELANQLFGQSEDSAYKALGAATSEQQNKINTLLNMLGLYQGERAYGDSRSDLENERAMAEARLTGNYKGNPTLDFLDYQRLASNSVGSGGGSRSSSGGGGSLSEAKSSLTKTETLNRIKGMTFSDAYKELSKLNKEGVINDADMKKYADVKFFEDKENDEIYNRYRTAMGRLATDEDRVKYLQGNRQYINDYMQEKLLEAFDLA
ncbi:MAG: hypothetical protein PHE79_08720 [Eubacteriales bacterium]|nr:hypothetical protein [Eubacteriales bacterium]